MANIDPVSIGIDTLSKIPTACKEVAEARLANSTRTLVNDVRAELPGLADAMKKDLASSTRLQDTLACTAIEDSQAFQQLASSQIHLNDTLEWAAVSNTDTLEKVAQAIGGTSQTVAARSNDAIEHMKDISDHAHKAVREIHGIRVIGDSLVDCINYYGRWMQAVSAIQIAQGYQAIQVLAEISQHLGDANSIAVSGSGGPDGFAVNVYDFIKDRIDEIDPAEVERHRFFVYHPDTNWYGAFRRLISENRLPPTFCAKSDDLDTLCQYMQAVRTQLNTETECEKNVIFHLLIPSWYRLSIKEPLHFSDSLQPLRVEGQKHKGKPLVEFNLPAAPARLLNGVANILDPNNQNAMAAGVSATVTTTAVGWGVNGACLAAGIGLGIVTGLGPFIAAPIWIGTAMPTMAAVAPALHEAIYDALSEEAPRILGSNQRLDMTGRHRSSAYS